MRCTALPWFVRTGLSLPCHGRFCSLTFHCLFTDLPLSFHCPSTAFHRLSPPFAACSLSSPPPFTPPSNRLLTSPHRPPPARPSDRAARA